MPDERAGTEKHSDFDFKGIAYGNKGIIKL